MARFVDDELRLDAAGELLVLLQARDVANHEARGRSADHVADGARINLRNARVADCCCTTGALAVADAEALATGVVDVVF